MPQGGPPMFGGKRDMATLREDVLCAYLVLRELNEHGQHYDHKARVEIVNKALDALRNVWADTGAQPTEMDPQMQALLRSGRICRVHPRRAAPT
jgi:hypothetical protein